MIASTHESSCTKLTHEDISHKKKSSKFLGCVLRIILFDIPLLLLFLTYAAIVWFSYVHDKYLLAQLHALTLAEKNTFQDVTYYMRCCTLEDFPSIRSSDLFLPLDTAPDDAYSNQLIHGFTAFSSILKPQTSENLRSYILSRNQKISEDEVVYIHAPENRHSIGLGPEEETVRKALIEIGTSPRLRPVLEAILGPDPALIELAAITATYGAKEQVFHQDAAGSGSPTMFGRSILPSYSIFIQLQNTTKEMGATSSCPGTHFCVLGNWLDICEDHGFQVVNEYGVWGQGDAVLMNHNSVHSGAAHNDPYGMDRVMLILSFVPKPSVSAESRRLPHEISYSKRWDMWGFTLNDLASADTTMRQPWRLLRSIGLYKAKSASWGIDFVTSAIMRSTNGDDYSQKELEAFLSRGGFPFLSNWLQHVAIDWDNGESWPEFIRGTKEKCENFFEKVCVAAASSYVIVFSLHSAITNKNGRVDGVFIRVTAMISIVFVVFRLAKFHVDQTEWAKGIVAGRRYSRALNASQHFKINDIGPTTFPTTNDVLIETRYGSEELSMYNDYISLGHPGNAFFRKLIDDFSTMFGQYDETLRVATTKAVIAAVLNNQGRFLYQGPDGYWMWISDDKYLLNHVKHELDTASNLLHAYLLKKIRFLSSKLKYGMFRNSALSRNHAIPHIENLKNRIVKQISRRSPAVMVDPRPKRPKFMITTTARYMYQFASQPKRASTLLPYHKYEEPFLGAWIVQGDAIETFENDEWFVGLVLFVHARGYYEVQYPDRSTELVNQFSIRPFHDYQVGENLTCYIHETDDTDSCIIRQILDDGSKFNVTISGDGRQLLLKLGYLSRHGPRIRTKYTTKK